MDDDFGPWASLTLQEITELFRSAPFRWWIVGGLALELHLGMSWRDHHDIDVGICRLDATALHGFLPDWSLFVAADGGGLHPWDGEPLSEAGNENNVWGRRDSDGPWRLDVAIGAGDRTCWRFRRDPRIWRPWPSAVLQTPDGIPYLAPELQLLLKSKHLRPKDHTDAEMVIPRLDDERRRSLAQLLPPEHPWRWLTDGPTTDGPVSAPRTR